MKRVVLIFLLLAACTYDPTAARYVVDGDTLVLNNGSTIRLQGIDTPEKNERLYNRASYELQRRLVGRQLHFEGNETDKYGRLLRHVFAEGKHVNLELVQTGWARAYMHERHKYEAILNKAQQEARESNLGIWDIDEKSYERLAHRCQELGCPEGSLAVASKNGEVFYNCICSAAHRIAKENIVCFTSVQDAIAEGLRTSKRC